MARQHKPLTLAKLRLVQVARSRLGLANDDCRTLMMRAAGVSSSRDLTENGFKQLMEVVSLLGFQSDSNKRNLGQRPGFATAGQVAAIRNLWRGYTAGEGTEMQLTHWLSRIWAYQPYIFSPMIMGQRRYWLFVPCAAAGLRMPPPPKRAMGDNA